MSKLYGINGQQYVKRITFRESFLAVVAPTELSGAEDADFGVPVKIDFILS